MTWLATVKVRDADGRWHTCSASAETAGEAQEGMWEQVRAIGGRGPTAGLLVIEYEAGGALPFDDLWVAEER